VGALVSLSSCTIIRLPVILGYVSAAGKSRGKGILLSFSFACGIIIVYTFMGLALGFISNFTSKLLWASHYLYFAVGIILLFLGILFAGLIPLKKNNVHDHYQMAIKHSSTSYSAFILGILFAFLETPACPACGAALMVIGSLVVLKGSWLYSGLVFVSFAIGQSIPVLILGFSTSIFKYVVLKITHVEKVMGFTAGNILIVIGLILIILA